MKKENDTGGNKPMSNAERDREDLSHEVAGRDVGRVKRFMAGEANPASIRKRREQERALKSALMMRLQNVAYSALFDETMDKLRAAEAATETALDKARNALANAKSPEAIADAQARYDTLLRYQVDVLGNARDRISDEENPLSKDELQDIQKRIEQEAPPEIKSIIEPAASRPTVTAQDMSDMKLPPITQ